MTITGTCIECDAQVPFSGSHIDAHTPGGVVVGAWATRDGNNEGLVRCAGSFKPSKESANAPRTKMTAAERRLSKKMFG